MKVLGFDPGIATFGFGAIEVPDDNPQAVRYESCGVVATQPTTARAERLAELGRDLSQLINRFNPHLIGIERLYFTKNITSGIAVAEARGVALYLAAINNIPIVECTPQEIKSAVTGTGGAHKVQMQQMVRTILQLSFTPQPDDAADALAVAIAASQIYNSKQHV